MIPTGPFHPDAAGINTRVCREARNCIPAVGGFKPLKGPVAISEALATEVRGAVTVLREDGSNDSFAGTQAELRKLTNTLTWDDVSRVTGGSYAVTAGERWRFAVFGGTLLAVAHATDPQKFSLSAGVNFEALGGSPPQARHIAIVRDFVVLGGLFEDELKLKWSGLNDSEGWTVGVNSSDEQMFPDGGPIRGIAGGEVGYVFQAQKVRRMTYVPGSATIFQFDELESGRGVAAPYSMVRLANDMFYFAPDGFYRFSLGSGASHQVGTGKWARWFLNDMRAGSELNIFGSVSPDNRAVVWAYISRDNPGEIPNRMLIYDWALDEASFADIDAEALADWLQAGYTLDNINSFGTLDGLPFSFDSPFWRGGSPLLGVFGADHKLAHLEGPSLEAAFVTSDGQRSGRSFVRSTRPAIDSTATTVQIASRERDGDPVSYEAEEIMEDDGTVPSHTSGHIIRARIKVPAGETWSYAKGIETDARPAGKR